MKSEAVIVCEQLTHAYPNGVEALKGIDLQVNRGEYVALVGQNGSGKTTLAKHFNGLLKPSSGSVRVNGNLTTDMRVSALSRMAGYVFQNPDDMLFCSSVEEEIGFGMKMAGIDEDKTTERVEHVIHELGLEDIRQEHPFALSLGDRQRVAVACVLCLEPEIFIFDEPTTGQDFSGSESIMELIDHLHDAGNTIIIITHDMPLVAEHAQRVVVLNTGHIALQGTPSEVFSNANQLEKLSLKPPQITHLAHQLGCPDGSILNVNQMMDWLNQNLKKPAGMPLEGVK